MYHPKMDEIRQLYAQGHSTRKVSSMTGVSKSYVHRLCKDITRTRTEAIRLACLPTSTHWRSSRAVARRKMERFLGRKLDRREHVHHIDGDYTNNDLSNLEVLSASVHAKLHHPANPIPRHERPARKIYMAEYNKFHRKERSICGWCKVEFLKDKYWKNTTCSPSCGVKLYWSIKRAHNKT